ncbi:MAG: PIG-L family deacetylase [Planctomycetaceae bacterium]|nr:PIG-L family deacetylase [Planctomycetaceae bacterium]
MGSRRAAVIVAHPDDEIIWCGGLILGNLNWDWSVLCLCRAGDADRAPKFRAVCRQLGLAGIMHDVDDANPLGRINPRRDIGEVIVRELGARRWDLCLTHGANGEYGHPRHRQVHRQVRRLVREGVLRCGRLWTFCYCAGPARERCRIRPGADVTLNLSAEEWARKRSLVRDIYGYGENSFEVQACLAREAFRVWPHVREVQRS